MAASLLYSAQRERSRSLNEDPGPTTDILVAAPTKQSNQSVLSYRQSTLCSLARTGVPF
jgi:hypothetical protein